MLNGRLTGEWTTRPHDASREPVLDIVRGPDVTTIVLGGELDLQTVRVVRYVIEDECERRPRRLVLDLAGVDFLDSSGLHLLLATHRRLTDQGGSLVLTSTSSIVRRIFEIGGLDRELTLDDREPTGRPSRADVP